MPKGGDSTPRRKSKRSYDDTVNESRDFSIVEQSISKPHLQPLAERLSEVPKEKEMHKNWVQPAVLTKKQRKDFEENILGPLDDAERQDKAMPNSLSPGKAIWARMGLLSLPIKKGGKRQTKRNNKRKKQKKSTLRRN